MEKWYANSLLTCVITIHLLLEYWCLCYQPYSNSVHKYWFIFNDFFVLYHNQKMSYSKPKKIFYDKKVTNQYRNVKCQFLIFFRCFCLLNLRTFLLSAIPSYSMLLSQWVRGYKIHSYHIEVSKLILPPESWRTTKGA